MSAQSADALAPKRVVMVGVGGATCSGKSTLALFLQAILPGSFIVHQDDFAPPPRLIPVHPVYKVQDWDSPTGAIDWPRLRSSLAFVKEHGRLPASHTSHHHLNTKEEVDLDPKVLESWREKFRHKMEEDTQWIIVDGFLMYWDPEVISYLDVRLFLRTPREELEARRRARDGYHTAEQFDFKENEFWRDPPHYFEQIVWPAYVEAHRELFEGGDVDGRLITSGGKVDGLVEIDGRSPMEDELQIVCPRLLEVAKKGDH